MLFLKRGLMAAGALALAAMLLNFVAPRAAHALVATAVQVMNTSATPVMNRDVDAAGRNPYYLQCNASSTACWTAVVPSGYTFVLDSVSILGHPAVSGGGIQRCEIMPASPASDITYSVAPIYLGNDSGSYSYTSNLTAYTASGSSIRLWCGPQASTVTGVFAGHLVSAP